MFEILSKYNIVGAIKELIINREVTAKIIVDF